jgi:hypothetical protein
MEQSDKRLSVSEAGGGSAGLSSRRLILKQG